MFRARRPKPWPTPRGAGGTWNRDGVILFAPADGGLFRVAAAGGEPVQVTALDQSRRDTAHRHPRFLPDGVHFLFTVFTAKPEFSGIYVGALDSKETKRLGPGTSQMDSCRPSRLFTRENTLMAQRFDIGRLELSGDPFQVAENVPTIGAGLAGFSASRNGALAYRTGDAAGGRRLTWFSRDGEIEGNVWTQRFTSTSTCHPTASASPCTSRTGEATSGSPKSSGLSTRSSHSIRPAT